MFKNSIASIQESECIGCVKCIQACPVDAIVGAPKMIHSIIDHECIGCGLCVDPCPVDCITMLPKIATMYDKTIAKERAIARKQRLLDEQNAAIIKAITPDEKRSYVLQALARAISKKKHGQKRDG